MYRRHRAQRGAQNAHRQKNRQEKILFREALHCSRANVEIRTAPEERRADMLRSIARLPERERQIVHLKFRVGLSNAQIASHMGISEGSVRKYLSRAGKQMRAVLRQKK